MPARHAEDGGEEATTNETILLDSETSVDSDIGTDISMDSDSGISASSLSSAELYLQLLWDFFEPHMGCGYIDLNRFLWGCAWLHVYINSEDRNELEELFQYYGDGGRLPSSRFPCFLRSWGDERQSILLRRCVMECDWHT